LIAGWLNALSEVGRQKENSPTFRHATLYTPGEIKKYLSLFGHAQLHYGVYYDSNFEMLNDKTDKGDIQPAFIATIVQKSKTMQIAIEISYYALTGDYAAPVKDFLERLSQHKMIGIETGNNEHHHLR